MCAMGACRGFFHSDVPSELNHAKLFQPLTDPVGCEDLHAPLYTIFYSILFLFATLFFMNSKAHVTQAGLQRKDEI